jgi:hypothetical protein
VLPQSVAANEMPGVVRVEENTLPVVALGALWDLFFFSSSFACLQPRYLAGWGFSPSASRQLQHAGVDVVFPFSGQTAGWLFAIYPDVTELLAVVALRKGILASICLHPDSNVAESWQTENFLGLCRPRQGYEERGEVYDFRLLGS